MSFKTRTYQFFRWLRDTLDMLCDRPNHLQRLSAIGAGMAVGIFVIALVAIITWFGTQSAPLALVVVPILGNALYGFIAVFAICVVVIMALVRGLGSVNFTGPNGVGLSLETTDKVPDADECDDRGGWGRHH